VSRTRVLRVDPAAEEAAAREAATVLRAHGLVAFPTETFYGLGAAALDAAAVARLIEAKGRPEGKPLLVLVDSIAMVASLVEEIPPRARELMTRHWPGALTLVLRARDIVPFAVTAGTRTVGVRLSSHPLARRVVAVLGAPVTAPSANVSDAAPPTTAAEVLAQLDGRIELVLDGGATPGGLPSTVLDVTADPPRMIREGAVRV
jgi:L-threonylcarbamoyladenylate synthase